jgi:hypothetical protein
MVRTGNPTVFPCGRGFLPGTQGPGGGGSEPTIPVLIPQAPPIDPPFIPSGPAEVTKWKCVEMSDGPPNRPKPGFRFVNPPWRECRPCNGQPTGLGYGPALNPKKGELGCIHPNKVKCEKACPNPEVREGGPITGGPTGPSQAGPTAPGPAGPAGGTGGGPITGGTQYYKCVAKQLQVCPDDETIITAVVQACEPCSPNIVLPNNQVIPDLNCIFSSLAECTINCISPKFTGNICPPTQGPTTGQPSRTSIVKPISPREPLPGILSQIQPPKSPSLSVSIVNQSNQITTNQQATNAKVVSVDPIVSNEDFRDIQAGIDHPVLFEPNLNFFRVESNNFVDLVPNNSNRNVLNSEVTSEVSELLSNKNSNESWNEVILQNLSDDQLLVSLNPKLVNAFQYLRYAGGEPIGVPVLLGVIRKHILQGTLDEFDPNFYINAAQSQINQNFEILKKPELQEHADRLAIDYLKNNLYTYVNNKSSNWRNFQINRVRPLNEDVGIKVKVTTLDGSLKNLEMPNEGIQVDKITALDQLTVPSVGAPDKLNLGDGGGYYVDSKNLQKEGVAVPTDNIIPDSYYAPAPVRVKVLNMLGIDPAITITASSSPNQHEFQTNDSGASAIKPLFFAINLDSINGDYISDSLVETYSATYSLLTASSDIQVHLNNNALNTAVLSIDYRDPIYRYILDTETFTASLKDFNINGFKDKAFSSIGSRFVRNIPFGFVVTPVAGGKYNPLNGNSSLDKHEDVHVRSLSVIPAIDATIDETPAPIFRSYSLTLEDGVDRVGIAEPESTQNIGYRYIEENFTQTFYSASSGDYGYSSTPPSAQGTAYMLREVIDYLSSTYDATTVTWYDIYSRMPITKVGEMFYDSNRDLILEIANGMRGGIRIENVESGHNTPARVIPDDSKTIITQNDRRNVTTVKI